ncbi:hypothetical protein VTN77DRAFT_9569 [Rasamsonia byssochlamydoides]|uniref:uncharacterized protein n=1 Tax=Rasamsonia byssochlamydoides TaxID=89139 RepID=UPI0037438FEF
MPPKKKPKLSSRPASTTPQIETAKPLGSTTGPGETAPKPDLEHDLVNDPWTDEQETALLKGIVRWKPVGMHKHFRMLAISEYMKSQGYAPAHEEHTRIPGIWKKLGTLYNLPALDEREDSIIADGSDESEYCPFELPEDEFGELMFSRRLAAERSSSPAESGQPESRRGSTVGDTDEPRSSPAPSRGRRGKGPRTTTRGTRTTTRLQVEVENLKKPSSDRASAADEDEEMEDAAAANEDEGDEEATDGGKEDSEEEEAEAEAASSPATRNTRTQTSRGKKDKGARSGTTGRRGRRR